MDKRLATAKASHRQGLVSAFLENWVLPLKKRNNPPRYVEAV